MIRGTRSMRLRAKSRTARRAAAVVETAVVTPLLMTMMLGVIEFGWVFMIQQSITNAVREACRVGILPGASDNEIKDRFVEAMNGTGLAVSGDMVTIEQATGANMTVTVRASMPYADVSLLGGSFPFWAFNNDSPSEGDVTPPADKMIGAVCSMRKEGI